MVESEVEAAMVAMVAVEAEAEAATAATTELEAVTLLELASVLAMGSAAVAVACCLGDHKEALALRGSAVGVLSIINDDNNGNDIDGLMIQCALLPVFCGGTSLPLEKDLAFLRRNVCIFQVEKQNFTDGVLITPLQPKGISTKYKVASTRFINTDIPFAGCLV